MSTLHSAYSTKSEQYLQGYRNRENGRELVRELIEDLVNQRLEALDDRELQQLVPKWASAHPIALLEEEFHVNIHQHDSPIDPEGS